MKKKIIIFIALFIFLGTGIFYYVNSAILPSKLRAIFIEKSQEWLGRPASINSISFSFVKGFIIEGITIFEKDLNRTPLLHIDRLSFRILYLPILRENKIIIPSLTVEKPVMSFIHQPDHRWNFSDILEKQNNPKANNDSLSLLVASLLIQDARLTLMDNAPAVPLSEALEHFNLTLRFSLPNNVKFEVSTSLADTSPAALLSMKGVYHLPSKKLSSQVNLQNIPLVKFISSYAPLTSVQINNGILKTAHFDVTLNQKDIAIKGSAQSEKLSLKFEDDKEFSGNPTIDFNIQGNMEKKDGWRYQGVFNPNKASLSGIPYVDTVKELSGNIAFDSGKIKTDSLSGVVQGEKIQLAGIISDFDNPMADLHATLLNVDLAHLQNNFSKIFEGHKILLKGSSNLILQYKGPLVPFNQEQLSLQADLNNVSVNSKRLPQEISNITGKIKYLHEVLSLNNINALFLDSKFNLNGSITNLEKPLIDVEATSASVNLAGIASNFPEVLKNAKVKQLSGNASVKLTYKGPPSITDESVLHLTASLNNASLRVEQLPEIITNINGKISCSKDSASWENLKATFENNIYIATGQLRNFNEPIVETTLASEAFNLTTKSQFMKDAVKIISLNGTYLHSPFDASGDLFLSEDEPKINLKTTLNFNLKDLSRLLPQVQEKLLTLKPSGVITLKGTIDGKSKDWRKWNNHFDATSPEISLLGYRFTNIDLKYVQNDQEIKQCDLAADLYDGKINLNLTANIAEENLPCLINANVAKVDLAKLKNDTIWKNQNISGTFSSDFKGKGSLSKPNTVEGQGSVLINNGHLWQLNLLKGLGQLLFIPEFENITFNEAKGDFTIKNERVTTGNLQLTSPSVTLECFGWIDFAGNMDFDIASTVSEEMIAKSASLKKLFTTILTQGDAYLTIKLTGSLKEPKYRISPTGMLKKTTNFILDNLKGIFQ